MLCTKSELPVPGGAAAFCVQWFREHRRQIQLRLQPAVLPAAREMSDELKMVLGTTSFFVSLEDNSKSLSNQSSSSQ